MQETVGPKEPRQVSCEVKSHNHPTPSAIKCNPSLYNQSSCNQQLRLQLNLVILSKPPQAAPAHEWVLSPLTHFSGAVPGLYCGLVITAAWCSCLRTGHGITVLKIVNVQGARLWKFQALVIEGLERKNFNFLLLCKDYIFYDYQVQDATKPFYW